MNYRINSSHTAAVSLEVPLQPMTTCPIGVKVQLYGAGGVLVYGQWDGKNTFFKAWAPLPYMPKDGLGSEPAEPTDEQVDKALESLDIWDNMKVSTFEIREVYRKGWRHEL